MSYIEDEQRGEVMGADISLGLFDQNSQQSSSADALRRQREKLFDKLQAGKSEQKERKGVIVELAALDKDILHAAYHEETVRLENKRLKNEEYTAMSIRARNKVRRQRENLLHAESMRRLCSANSQLNDQIQGSANADNVAEDVKAARELSAEAAQVAQRRKNDEWKEYAETKSRKRKKGPQINISI